MRFFLSYGYVGFPTFVSTHNIGVKNKGESSVDTGRFQRNQSRRNRSRCKFSNQRRIGVSPIENIQIIAIRIRHKLLERDMHQTVRVLRAYRKRIVPSVRIIGIRSSSIIKMISFSALNDSFAVCHYNPVSRFHYNRSSSRHSSISHIVYRINRISISPESRSIGIRRSRWIGYFYFIRSRTIGTSDNIFRNTTRIKRPAIHTFFGSFPRQYSLVISLFHHKIDHFSRCIFPYISRNIIAIDSTIAFGIYGNKPITI